MTRGPAYVSQGPAGQGSHPYQEETHETGAGYAYTGAPTPPSI
jgi:hypothetical protein